LRQLMGCISLLLGKRGKKGKGKRFTSRRCGLSKEREDNGGLGHWRSPQKRGGKKRGRWKGKGVEEDSRVALIISLPGRRGEKGGKRGREGLDPIVAAELLN